MNNFLSNSSFDFSNKRVLIRIDCDVDLVKKDGRLQVDEDFRLKQILPTLKFLDQAGVKRIILIGHLGRPDGQPDEKLTLAPIAAWFTENYKKCNLYHLQGVTRSLLGGDTSNSLTSYLSLLNNLRFHTGETNNDQKFAQDLSSLADVYINEAFATSHRKHASIVGLPKYLPSFLGLNFEKEIKNLTKIKSQAERPLVIVIGGAKEDKLNYVPFLAELADKLLIGGKLPLILKRRHLQGGVAPLSNAAGTFDVPPAAHLGGESFDESVNSVIVAHLSPNQRDISRQSIEDFKNQIKGAGSIFMAGPLGAFEEKENSAGTFEIANFIADSPAFSLAAGGDTHRVLSQLNLWDQFDFVSTGGGAVLQFLQDETLPGIEAISNS